MLKDSNFLCEIGTEEIPAGYIPGAIESVKKTVEGVLREARIDFTGIEAYGTPRRIAFMVSRMADRQREETAEIKGPSAKAAYDASGAPTKALEGFLKGNGVSTGDIFMKETDKGQYVYARKKLESRESGEIIPGLVRSVLTGLKFPKQMHWSDKKLLFPRPVRYFLIMFKDAVVDFEIEGIRSSNRTRGHYIQHDGMAEVKRIMEYEDILKKNGVIVNQRERKELIRAGLHEAAAKAGGVLNEDESLLDTVTFLVESPFIATCEFNRDFLRIPDVVLIAEMKEHQKYFSVMGRDGKLTNNFLVVSNNPVNENVKIGNVRVITARFNDAGFFYKEDRKMKLHERVESLKSVLFHKELGTIYDKVTRMDSIATHITGKLGLDNSIKEKIKRAVFLSKADLNTAMVFEFPSLQGKVGRIYALSDGEDPEVADALDDHYRPRFQDDALPGSVISITLSLAEKFDNIFGSFSVGNIPKGSQDPYALRRQAGAVIEMLVEKEINLSLRGLLEHIAGNYRDGGKHLDAIIEFFRARAKTYFTESGFRYDEIDACMSVNETDFLELHRRARSLNEFRKDARFSEMLLGFKRMNNILSGFRKENAGHALKFDASLLKEKEEKELHEFFSARNDEIGKLIRESRYIDLFRLLIEGKNIIDSFFDKVLVMDGDVRVRDNRLSILEQILGNFASLLDFSKIADT